MDFNVGIIIPFQFRWPNKTFVSSFISASNPEQLQGGVACLQFLLKQSCSGPEGGILIFIVISAVFVKMDVALVSVYWEFQPLHRPALSTDVDTGVDVARQN